MLYDVVIIGGGMSGLCSAIKIKRECPEYSVIILERLNRVGRKIALTGNGRCNISNLCVSKENFHSENRDFSNFAIENHPLGEMENFFYSIGVTFISEGDKLFPASLQASSVVDALRFECDRLGVETSLETLVTNIKYENSKYTVFTNNQTFTCKNLIAAGGLYSGGAKLGCDGSLLSILKGMGIKATKTFPAIVQLKTETDIVKQLKGIKINADVTLKSDGKIIRKDFGETLFCDYGLSGPPILQISGLASKHSDKKVSVCLDILPNTSFNDLFETLLNRRNLLSFRSADEFFTGMLNKRLGQVLLKISGFKLNERVKDFDNARIKTLCSNVKNLEFEVLGNTGFVNSQVTLGGLDTNEFDFKTMQCNKFPRLYATGEILDITGDCGGYNLTWAYCSAMCAANSIIGDKK